MKVSSDCRLYDTFCSVKMTYPMSLREFGVKPHVLTATVAMWYLHHAFAVNPCFRLGGPKRDAISTYTAHRRKADKAAGTSFPSIRRAKGLFLKCSRFQVHPVPISTNVFVHRFIQPEPWTASFSLQLQLQQPRSAKKGRGRPRQDKSQAVNCGWDQSVSYRNIILEHVQASEIVRPALGRTGYHLCLFHVHPVRNLKRNV